MKKLFLLATHTLMLAIGFGLGVYFLPILTAPKAPTTQHAEQLSSSAKYSGTFKRDLKGSDFFHWGEGKVSITDENVVLMGKLAPGPDYKLYLTQSFVETEEEFNKIKSESKEIGDIRTFENFIVSVPDNVDLSQYNTVVVWCESFGEFITAAKYR